MHIHTIITHRKPHYDELLAITLLQTFGKDEFPGIDTATFDFWDAGSRTPDGRPWEAWHQDGYVLVGVGGGMFDEHPSDINPRAETECAATLVAKHFGIEEEEWLAKILRYALINDTKGAQNPNEIASLIKLANDEWFDARPMEFMEWALQTVGLRFKQQYVFFRKVGAEFTANAKKTTCYHQGRETVISFVESDSTDIAAYARSTFGHTADVVVQKNLKGQVIIMTDKRSGISLDDVVRMIRLEELSKLKARPFVKDLAADGTVPEVPNWHYHKPAMQLLNGSKSAPNTPPTTIPFTRIIELVKAGLEKQKTTTRSSNSDFRRTVKTIKPQRVRPAYTR